uniref:Embigin n=1 Tax=Pelusios castaneus TaxID=367368 RepID=A0A8C8VEI5_9SAUR
MKSKRFILSLSGSRDLLFICFFSLQKLSIHNQSFLFDYANFYTENILVNRFSSDPVEEKVIVDSPVNIELSCSLTGTYTGSATIVMMWKKDNETVKISNVPVNATRNVLNTQYNLNIRDRNQMRSYTCTFQSEKEVKATFHLQVPQIEGKEHHVVSYVGDSVVLVCKSVKYIPVSWIWYMSNGSDQVAINDSLMPDKYIVKGKYGNTTKLKILKLSDKDDGSYWCQAVFKLGESKGKVSLKVLTYMVPLKPFLVIAAEVIIVVTIIFLYEMYSKKKQMHAGKISLALLITLIAFFYTIIC